MKARNETEGSVWTKKKTSRKKDKNAHRRLILSFLSRRAAFSVIKNNEHSSIPGTDFLPRVQRVQSIQNTPPPKKTQINPHGPNHLQPNQSIPPIHQKNHHSTSYCGPSPPTPTPTPALPTTTAAAADAFAAAASAARSDRTAAVAAAACRRSSGVSSSSSSPPSPHPSPSPSRRTSRYRITPSRAITRASTARARCVSSRLWARRPRSSAWSAGACAGLVLVLWGGGWVEFRGR